MAEDSQYETHKRKYEEDTSPPPPPRRVTGFSDGPTPQTAAAAYDNVPPPPANDEFQLVKQRLQELASRALSADAKRNKVDNNGGGFSTGAYVSSDQKSMVSNIQVRNATSFPVSHGYTGSKKIEIPNGRVGVIIGKAGETIKYLQTQSGARIQVTRDADHDPNLPHRTVELMGNEDQIAKAEQLINEVLTEADTGGGPGAGPRRQTGAGSEQFVLKVPNNKVGLVIGKGGETIKNIQARSGARVQVIPLHPPPGDMSGERTVQIDGSREQIEIAKQMVNEVIENRNRNPGMSGGGYSQQGSGGYQAQPPTSYGYSQPPQQAQQQPGGGGYGYMQQQQQQQQPGAYSAQQYMSQPPYSGYPPQPAGGGYTQNWDPAQTQQPAHQGTGYDYYGQQAPPQQQSGAPTDNSGYNYNQPPTSAGYGQQQGYDQHGYATGYQAPPPSQPGYGQQPQNPQSGYDQQQQSYGSTPGYGNVTNPPQDGHQPSYGETGQQGYPNPNNPNPNPAYPTHGGSQAGYGMPPTSQAGYGAAAYGPPQGQRTPPNPAAYGQPPQQSPSQAGYTQPAPGQPGYPPASQPPAQSPYGQPDGGASRGAAAAASGGAPYGGVTAQQGAYPPPYGAPPATPPSYAQQQAAYYGSAYAQPPAYSADGSGAAAATTPAPQAASQPSGAPKASPQS